MPEADAVGAGSLQGRILQWYDEHARDLPWRSPEVSPWGVLVSEIMLQQTPVARVIPIWQEWMKTWPTAADLAASPSGEAIRAWGRLGYPRRALRLHAAAVDIVSRFDGAVPSDYADLRSLPGIGDYTAAAVAAFGFGQAHAVLDTNVRRVLARVLAAEEFPRPAVTVAERAQAAALLPPAPTAAKWSVAVMELGALVCTASRPRCASCPVGDLCAWVAAGRPAYDGPERKGQSWAGTDRMVRGRLMAVLRDAEGPVSQAQLDAAWDLAEQRDRALAGLLDDGLAVRSSEGMYSLPN